MAAVRAPQVAAAVAGLTVVAVPLALLGARLAPSSTPSATGARVQAVDVAADRAGACTIGNLLEDSPKALFVGIHAAGLRRGARVTLSITGPNGTDTATAAAPGPDRSGCTVVSVPAAIDHATVWPSGDYAISVALGTPPTPSGPVTAFSIAAGITDD